MRSMPHERSLLPGKPSKDRTPPNLAAAAIRNTLFATLSLGGPGQLTPPRPFPMAVGLGSLNGTRHLPPRQRAQPESVGTYARRGERALRGVPRSGRGSWRMRSVSDQILREPSAPDVTAENDATTSGSKRIFVAGNAHAMGAPVASQNRRSPGRHSLRSPMWPST
jgi:hypothetical protein